MVDCHSIGSYAVNSENVGYNILKPFEFSRSWQESKKNRSKTAMECS